MAMAALGWGLRQRPATQDLDEMQILRVLAPSKQKLWGWADHQGYNTLWVSQHLRSSTQAVLLEHLVDLN